MKLIIGADYQEIVVISVVIVIALLSIVCGVVCSLHEHKIGKWG